MNPVLSLPPQPLNAGRTEYQSEWNTWVANFAKPAMIAYFDRFKGGLEARGFAVDVTYSQGVGSDLLLVIPVWTGTLSKSGVTANWTLTLGQAESREPEDLAAHYADWVWGQEARATGNPALYSPPPVTPGPATTVPTGGGNPSQAPPNPNMGTVVTLPPVPAELLYNFDEWNAVNQAVTGRPGPPPEDVGVPDRNARITIAEWHRYVDPWFAGTIPGTSVEPPPSASGGGIGAGTGTQPAGVPTGTGWVDPGPASKTIESWLAEEKIRNLGVDYGLTPANLGVPAGSVLTANQFSNVLAPVRKAMQQYVIDHNGTAVPPDWKWTGNGDSKLLWIVGALVVGVWAVSNMRGG